MESEIIEESDKMKGCVFLLKGVCNRFILLHIFDMGVSEVMELQYLVQEAFLASLTSLLTTALQRLKLIKFACDGVAIKACLAVHLASTASAHA